MAKRKRLTPARSDFLAGPASGQRAPETKAMSLGAAAPIAQVAGAASAQAALDDLAGELAAARAEGRMVVEVALDQIDENHLMRDRLVQDEDELTALMDSIRARGQQIPIELVALEGAGKPYGLISGWRRLTALKRLFAEAQAVEFATVHALLVVPETAQDAYLAMVEENEIRVNLSHYERARIAVRALRQGVFEDQRAALRGLYGSTTRSKRSKIGSFIGLVEALDDVLYHPTAISEKLGLALVRELGRDPAVVSRVRARLADSVRDTAVQEVKVLEAVVAEGRAQDKAAAPSSSQTDLVEGIELRFSPKQSRITLTGTEVDAALAEALEAWLQGR